MVLSEAKRCSNCDTTLIGRSDKKFCSDRCRGIANNHKRAKASYPFIRNVNNALIINRNILASLIAASNNKTNSDVLKQMGFIFKYHTHTFNSKAGKTYHYCYDYGYLQIEADKYLIVKSGFFAQTDHLFSLQVDHPKLRFCERHFEDVLLK